MLSPSPTTTTTGTTHDLTSGKRGRPENIGILAIQPYIPKLMVEQSELEKYDKVSTGKYTIGLGQKSMSFCSDREDICSISLTVLQLLFKNFSSIVNAKNVGRLEVGTESMVDKSKSVKSVLMQLLGDNCEIEGADTYNACYGGTNALFNAINWIESSSWDGRVAVVIAADIAVYEPGPARATGGAGAVAIVIGPDAPLVFEPSLRSTHMSHCWDFYKPNMASEYPIVDGKTSIDCYYAALDSCYLRYMERLGRRTIAASRSTDEVVEADLKKIDSGILLPTEKVNKFASISDVDYMLFHCPFSKLVQKSFARLHFIDFYHQSSTNVTLEDVDVVVDDEPVTEGVKERLIAIIASSSSATLPVKDALSKYYNGKDKAIEGHFINVVSKESFEEKVLPGLQLAKETGNSYCASLYLSLVSLLAASSSFKSETEPHANNNLLGKRIALFSYGSGSAASLFSLICVDDNIYENMVIPMRLDEMLASRMRVDPHVYSGCLEEREKLHKNLGKNNRHNNNRDSKSNHDGYIVPSSDPRICTRSGTFYLDSIDGVMKRRKYCINNNQEEDVA